MAIVVAAGCSVGGDGLQRHALDPAQGMPAAELPGRLVHHDRCDWIQPDAGPEDLVLWPATAELDGAGDERRITVGERTYRVGRRVRLPGGEVSTDHATDGKADDLPSGCRPAKAWIVSPLG